MMESDASRVRSLNRNSPVPLYFQLLEALREQIESGLWQPRDILPSESDLCQLYDVSRTVVRQALDGLERPGVIRRVKGKGAFVSERKVMAYLMENPNGFYAGMAAQGMTIETRVLERDVVPAPAKVAEALQIPEGSLVLRLERLRYLHSEPVFLGTSYLPIDLCGNLDDEDFSQSMNAVLTRRCGLWPTTGKRIIESVAAGHYESEMLDVSVGMPLFRLTAVTYSQNGRPMEHTVAWLRGDRIAFEVTLRGQPSERADEGQRMGSEV